MLHILYYKGDLQVFKTGGNSNSEHQTDLSCVSKSRTINSLAIMTDC